MNDDLARMFRMFSRIPNGLNSFAEVVRFHIVTLGGEKIEQRLSSFEGKDDREALDDPQYIKVGVLQWHLAECHSKTYILSSMTGYPEFT